MAPLAPDTVQTPVPLLGSTVKVTGLPDPPPVAVSVADCPAMPEPGAVKVMTCAPALTVMVCWTCGAALYPLPAAWLASMTQLPGAR